MATYYETRIKELQEAGAEVIELGDEALVAYGAGGTYIYVGGDCPAAYYTCKDLTVDQVREIVDAMWDTDADALEEIEERYNLEAAYRG